MIRADPRKEFKLETPKGEETWSNFTVSCSSLSSHYPFFCLSDLEATIHLIMATFFQSV